MNRMRESQEQDLGVRIGMGIKGIGLGRRALWREFME